MVDQEQEETWAADSEQHGAEQSPLYNSICLVCYKLGVSSVNEYLASILEHHFGLQYCKIIQKPKQMKKIQNNESHKNSSELEFHYQTNYN